jgi:hypothetical protein
VGTHRMMTGSQTLTYRRKVDVPSLSLSPGREVCYHHAPAQVLRS